MNVFLKTLEDYGPFTAPLCLGMGLAIRWLLQQLNRQRDELAVARGEATALREKRAGDLEKAAREYAAQGESMRKTLSEWHQTVQSLMGKG